MKQLNWKYTVYLVLALSIIYIGCQAKADAPVVDRRIPVKLSKVVREAVSVPVHTSGRLFPGVQAKLSFKTGGIVSRLYVDEGEGVKKGQLLASLDLAEVGAYKKQADNGYAKAKRDKERVENLYKDRAATLEQLQNVKTELEVAESNLEIAGFNLKHSKIHAPSGGKILKRLVDGNELVESGQPVFLFGSTDNRWIVRVGVNLRDIVKLKREDGAKVRFDAYPDREFDAWVTQISEAVDGASGTCEVELEIRGRADDLKLIAGFIASVDIYPSEKKDYTRVPIDALVEAEGSEGFVFVVKEGKAQKVKVRVVHLMKEHALTTGESEGIAEVVTEGAPYLTDGSPVKVVK
ncbi:MAG: efflux RND transporter periplasmic adaptor subunit [bacterium]|nr:efflux RND transporter periplasmic adaptor subunit [bacterium]